MESFYLLKMEILRLPSYAKINLGLIIFGKRKDGYHEIQSILQQIDLKDEIELRIKVNPEIYFHCDNPEIPTGTSNLCVLAANLIKDMAGVENGVEIFLKKTIPAGAGLGGGSSNAATVLLGLNKLWNLNLTSQQLQTLACQIGSDVPFFIHGGTALAGGRGELLKPFDLQGEITILIVFPAFIISTKWAYSQMNLNLTKRNKNTKLIHYNDRNYEDFIIRNLLKNNLEDVVFKKHPILGVIKQQLYKNNAIYASMSGSGSAILGIFQKRSDALTVKNFFCNQYPTFVTRPIHWGYVEANQASNQILQSPHSV